MPLTVGAATTPLSVCAITTTRTTTITITSAITTTAVLRPGVHWYRKRNRNHGQKKNGRYYGVAISLLNHVNQL